MPKRKIPEYQRKRLEEMSLFIKNWRLCENLSQREYSKLADTHINTLQRFETHKNNISVLTLFAFIDTMEGMTLSEFFAGME